MSAPKINGGTVQIMMDDLARDGFTKAIVYFDGCGDSGSVESVSFYKGEQYIPTDLTTLNSDTLKTKKYPIVTTSTSYDEDSKKWVDLDESKLCSAPELIEHIAYQKLDESNIDWYNNDGGYGELMFIFNKKKIKLNMNTRYTEVNTYNFSYSYTGLYEPLEEAD